MPWLVDLDRAFKLIDEEREWVTSLLADMVSIPTVSPSGEKYEEFASMLSERLAEKGLEVTVHRVPQDYVRE
ncbi:MAG: hypothetical protein QI199_02860, partial [Candidatus Korarchaeota archaeon]|nr:hypothetical protein [Candidatus Korarchaeota archaeon]